MNVMINLIRAEWFKLSRRPMAWVLLVLLFGLLVFQILGQFALVYLAQLIGLTSDGGSFTRQLEEYRRWVAFPGLFGAVFSQINSFGGVLAVIFTAGAMGSEYSWGTLRTQLARTPARGRYLVAKIVTILLLFAVAIILALLLGTILGGTLGMLVGRTGVISARDIAVLPLGVLRALYALLPYVLLTLCFTILGRSLLAGVAGGLLYLVLEVGFSSLAILQVFGTIGQAIYNLTIQPNISALTLLNITAFGLHPEVLAPLDLTRLPSPLQATLVIGAYSALFFAYACRSLIRRDITGAS